eukprot:TRINITY_DN15029_c0_g1_i1.p1 TRINITY_DN15029_c0_g1~~TRINITY_DN15029_c0_g1_i1.p1  ORF type:complete len:425 (+),score=129.60 TRINITY_DN15029_c0_g1_i1:53-1327(+)
MALQRMQSLVGAAGEALGLTEDPLHTRVGMKIEEATSDDLVMENWDLNMEICDIINSTEGGPVQAVRAIKKKLQNSLNKSQKGTLLTLTVLETCVKNCGKNFIFLVCQKEFADELINRISPNLEPSQAIQDKVLSLIQSWAHAFSSDPDLRGVAEVYMDLKKKGVEFPVPSDDDLLLVQSNQSSPSKSVTSVSSSNSSHNQSLQQPPAKASKQDSELAERVAKGRKTQATRLAASGILTQGQAKKLERDLEITQRNMEVFSELLSELRPGQEHPEDKKLLLEVSQTCKEMQARVLELIGIVQHREITASLLDINDNMNNELLRFERYMNNCGEKSKVKDPEALSPDEILLQVPQAASRPISQVSEGSASLVKESKETDFEEIEAWMKEHEGDEDFMREEINGEDAISDEFNKFLEKRVEAVEKE